MFVSILKQTGKTLRVPNVKEDNLGSYTCHVDNGVDEAKSFRMELREDGKKIVRVVFHIIKVLCTLIEHVFK